MALVAIAYPEISPAGYSQIQEYRHQHDPLYYHVVEPHVTFVFPVSTWESEPFLAEITERARGFPAIDFCLRCALLNKDCDLPVYHCLLAPDEGFGQIVRLHNRLYSAALFPLRALAVDFIPHLGAGNSTDPAEVLAMVEDWNRADFAIRGRITALDVAVYQNDCVHTIERVPLGVA